MEQIGVVAGSGNGQLGPHSFAGAGLCCNRDNHARLQRCKFDQASVVEGQVMHLPFGDETGNDRVSSLHQRSVGSDLHLFCKRADLQTEVDNGCLPYAHRKSKPDLCLKTRQAGAHLVISRVQIGSDVIAAFVRSYHPGYAGFGILNFN